MLQFNIIDDIVVKDNKLFYSLGGSVVTGAIPLTTAVSFCSNGKHYQETEINETCLQQKAQIINIRYLKNKSTNKKLRYKTKLIVSLNN